MGKTIILEGRYDSVTGKIVRDIFWGIKNTHDYPIGEMTNLQLPYAKDGTDWYETDKSNLNFEVELNIIRNPEIDTFIVESSYSRDDDSLTFNMSLNPNKEPLFYKKLYHKLQEDVRHEMEHLLQDMGRGGRPLISIDEPDTSYEYQKQLHEVPALVQGFYRRAKSERKPIDEVMIDDLDDEIAKGNLTKKEAEDLLRIWVLYSKRRLPKAIYSQH